MNNPYLNALAASAYIIGVVSVITSLSGLAPQQDNIMMPMAMLSLLVLSVATMGFLFFYRPLIMILDGKREEAVGFFLREIGTFAGIALVIFVASMTFFR